MYDRETIETIFLEAVEVSPSGRKAFLGARCGNDAELISEVQKLIDADEQAGEGEFLRSGLFGENEPDASPVEDAPPNDDADRFRVIRAFRQGGLGEVLIAHDRQLDRDVAVKQIKPRWKDSTEARQRFIQEAKVTGRLEHPGIVPVYAMGTWPDGQHYYAMRFIEGDTMKDVIDQYHATGASPNPGVSREDEDARGLRLRELLSRFVDVCNTIEYAHSKQVLHRDIKPSNIMVGPYGETLVVDWGLAKLLDEPAEESMTADLARALGRHAADEQGQGSGSTPTQVGGTVGTPNYMSPEQANGKLDEIGTRTDVYLLGATLYQILTGVPPHHEDSISKLLLRIGQGKLNRPRDVIPDVAPALESICLKAMATDPKDRYANPNQIADDVNRWMADQPVSVHNDNAYVRLNRWMRRHRTATSTIAVAAILLLIGGVFGSILWNVAKVREFQADEARRTKQLELEIKDRQRIAELEIAAAAAENLAQKEIARNRFSSALDVLANTMDGIESEDKLAEQVTRIRGKVERIGALVEFYRLADVVEQQNVLSRDTKALMACTAALKKLGIWDRPDWWIGLPADDLSPEQLDTLRWDVYQQLMLMDAMLLKTMGTRLAGDGDVGGWNALFRIGMRAMATNLGKPEAEAALIVSDRIDRFRVSESTRLYRSFAKWRLGFGRRLRGSDLGPTQNSADAHSLAVLSMIASVDPNFETVFSGYHGDDPLLSAREMFGRSAVLRPKYYGAHLGLGQVEYLLAQRKTELRWEDLAPSLRAFSQCITLLPERCFAHVDRSSVYRTQARLIAGDDRYNAEERIQRVAERLQWSLADAMRAMEFYDDHPWIGWQVGQTYLELGQVDRALKLWVRTGLHSYSLGEIVDTTFVGIDDVRGRGEIGDWLEAQLELPPSSIRFDRTLGYVALAAVRLNQARSDEALGNIESALSIDPDNKDARAIRGMILLRERASQTAKLDFQAVYDLDPDHPFAAFGLAHCLEDARQLKEAYAMYEIAESQLLSGENQAAAALGRCRTAALAGDYANAHKAIQKATAAEPACDIRTTVRSLTSALLSWKRAEGRDDDRVAALSDFLASIAKLPRASKVQPMPRADLEQPSNASMLNGGFELGSMRYWSGPSGARWDTVARFESSAKVTSSETHSGVGALRIDLMGPDSDSAPGDFDLPVIGRTGQIFSVIAGQRYEVACWVKADSVSQGAIRLLGPDGRTLIRIQGGTFPWRRVTAEFDVSTDQDGRAMVQGTVVPCHLQIVAGGTGTIWLDDFSCVGSM